MLRQMLLILLCFCYSGVLRAESDVVLVNHWLKGLAEYDEGQYAEAIKSFEAILAEDPRRGHVLYNLGNAYYKAGQKGTALGAYFAARRLLPRDPDLKANIRYIEKFTEDRLASSLEIPVWLRGFFWIDSLSVKESIYLAALFLGLSLGIFGFCFFFPKIRTSLVLAGAVCMVFTLILGAGVWAQRHMDRDWGAVSSAAVDVFSGKNKGAAVVFKLKEGAPVMVLEEGDGWAKVQISDGKKGWLPSLSLKYYKF
jgi:tetratricopeptide (TPR) repeat protein